MGWQELVADIYGRIYQALEMALKDVSQDDLNKQPHQDCNSMGWMVWHLTRVQDSIISTLKGDEQLWITDKWYARFNRPEDPGDSGGGHTSEQVAAFKSPDAETLLDYHRAVLERTRGYIIGLSADDLDKEIINPRFPRPLKVEQMLMITISDGLQHAGQVAYLGGLTKAQA